MTRHTLIDLNPDDYIQGLRCYPFIVNFGECNGKCNIFHDPSSRVCVPNKTEVNLNVFKMLTKINESENNKKIYIMQM